MPKYVYLFELDSVRKTDREIEIGQQALYNEIVGNGNIVVLTYNQFVDSRGFFSLLSIPEYYNNIISLFENGSIRLSQFGGTRTIVQYLLGSFDYDKEFIYSGWPLKSTQKRLLALIKRSLMYSDLSEIHQYMDKTRTEKELRDLFCEIGSEETNLCTDTCRDILEHLFWLLKTILRLSPIHTIYIPPRDVNEYKDFRFHDILYDIIKWTPPPNDSLWENAISHIRDVIKKIPADRIDDRSKHLQELLRNFKEDSADSKASYQYAEAIMNLTYNYVCEISVCNISKHYNIEDLSSQHNNRLTFAADFFSRLKQYWDVGDLDRRFLLDESNWFDKFSGSHRFPDFSRAVRMARYAEKETSCEQNCIFRYEYGLSAQRKKHTSLIRGSISRKIIFSLVCIIIACILELLFGLIQNSFDSFINFDTPFWNIIETLLFLIFTEFITTLLSNSFPELLSLSDALGGISCLIKDLYNTFVSKSDTYFNPCSQNIVITERRSNSMSVDFVISDAMKKYIKMKAHDANGLFRISDVYPIANTNDKDPEGIRTLKNISRLEEMYNYHFGVVYSSKFNTMVVDPIMTVTKSTIPFFPYERIIPTAGNGVVMVPRCGDRLILLRQYRHAIRRVQFAFPRGYGEPGISPDENAKKELGEEIGAVITRPVRFIGTVSPDSGLANTCAHVYLVDLDAYAPAIGHEGILDIVSCSEHDFEEMLCQNREGDCKEFDDGFTIAAYMLYKKYNEKKGHLSL